MKLKRCGSFDINANCTGFQIGLSIACEKIKFDKSIKNVLVIGTANLNILIGKYQKTQYSMEMDPGAALVSRVPKSYGLIATDIFTDSKAYEEVRLQGGGNLLTSENFSQKKKKNIYVT